MSLYEDIGGKDAVNAAVELFYDKVFADALLAPFFEQTDRPRQIAKQKAFLTYAFGGSPNYSGKSLRQAHKGAVAHGLTDTHFDAVAGHLQTTLQELGVAPALVSQVMQIAGGTRNDVLGR
jgi:hemoglobin